jgi:ribose transport system permease protein
MRTSLSSLSARLPAAYWLLIVGFLLTWALCARFGQGEFLTLENFDNFIARSVALGIVAIGQTFALLAASVDLSVANLISVTVVTAPFFMQGSPALILPAMLGLLAIGLFVGLVNGLIITRLRVSPLIATLGVGLLLQGFINASFGHLPGKVAPGFQSLAYGSLGPFPAPLLLLVGVSAAAMALLHLTRFGAHVYGVGGNAEVARLSGIRTTRVIIGAHMVSATGAVISGIFLASRLGSAAPWVGTESVYDLQSIAVAVMGGTTLAGGRGAIGTTLACVLVFSLIDVLFNQLGIDSFLKQVLRGLIVVAAVASYAVRERRAVA